MPGPKSKSLVSQQMNLAFLFMKGGVTQVGRTNTRIKSRTPHCSFNEQREPRVLVQPHKASQARLLDYFGDVIFTYNFCLLGHKNFQQPKDDRLV